MMNLEAVQPSSVTQPIPQGDAGTAATIARMRDLIDQGVKNSTVHECAAWVLKSRRIPQFDFEAEARAIYLFVLGSIRFTRDIAGKETLHSAEEILRLGIGDCDDFTILLCSLLGTIGHKTRIITISSVPDYVDQDRPFTHVFPEVLVNGRWITADAARREPGFGKSPRRYTRKRVWSVYSEEYVDVQGLNFYPMGYRMGDDAQIAATILPEATTGIADIITAERAAPQNLYPTTSVNAPGYQPSGYGNVQLPIGAGIFGGINTSTVVLLGIVGVGLVLAMRRR